LIKEFNKLSQEVTLLREEIKGLHVLSRRNLMTDSENSIRTFRSCSMTPRGTYAFEEHHKRSKSRTLHLECTVITLRTKEIMLKLVIGHYLKQH
jgi:hypothetical protein